MENLTNEKIEYFSKDIEALQADIPKRCENAVSAFNDIMQGKITSQVRNAHNYFMNSTDPAAGRNYEERTANLNKEIAKTFLAFMNARREEYRKTVCFYYKVDWNQPGNHSERILTCQQGFYLIKDSLKRTTNGDWKGGPYWQPDTDTPTSIKWKTGGHGRSDTFVDIQAKYFEIEIKNLITGELNIVRKVLNDMGIPTELPPFLD